MDVLTVAGARKSFGQVVALDGASFELRQAELLALLGPNGAGKTTLIRAISGRVRLDGGQVRLFGRALDAAATPRELGIVPQDVAIYPLLTARENLQGFGRLMGLAGTGLRRRIGWALDRTGLADRADEPARQFSGGMRRRLNIACALLHEPRILLMDEPTAGVDPQSRDRIYDMLAELAAGGVSVLITTHHLEEAEARCSRTVIIDHGRVIASGTVAELVDQTVGRDRVVTLRLDRAASAADLPHSTAEVDSGDPRVLRARLRDVAVELPILFERLRAAGLGVNDVEVRGATLQAVFIHLTGRDLRE